MPTHNYTLRPYQQAAADAALDAFKNSRTNGLIIIPTGGGKSWIIADIAKRLGQPLLIFCPSKELVLQDYQKMCLIDPSIASVFSASVGVKEISQITFATIGTAIHQLHSFDHFRYILVDESHLINAKGGQYEQFIHARPDRQVIGLTATPYRLTSSLYGSMLKFLTRTRPRIFDSVIYYVQVADLLKQGYLAPLQYFDLTAIDLSRLRPNSSGADFDEQSLLAEYDRTKFYDRLAVTTLRVLRPKDGSTRNGVLVFTRFTREADHLVQILQSEGISAAAVSAQTPKKERDSIVAGFKNGKIKVVANVGVLQTGFDHPALDTIILARPTKSLAWFYQAVGRAIRPYPDKHGWVIDLAGSYRQFGPVSDLQICVEKPNTQLYCVASHGRQLTNKLF